MKNNGFTLIELVVVIVILGILAVTALPRFVDLQSNARTNAIENLYGTFVESHRRLHAKIQVPAGVLENPSDGRFWVDVNGNGAIDGDSNGDNSFDGKDGEDILLIDDTNIDNNQLLKLVSISAPIVAVTGDINQAYIGYDVRGDGDIAAGNCRVYYNQSRFWMKTDGC